MPGATSHRPTALFVSPHLDDAVFSCGGTIARLTGLGWRVVVATVFTRTVARPRGFALACQTDKGIGPEVDYMALRRGEDAEACARLGAEPLWLDLPEAPHRGYGSAEALFGTVRPDDPAPLRLPAVLARLHEMCEPGLTLCPEAIGGHVDHLIVRDAAVRIAVARSRALACWRDQPYARRHRAPVTAGARPVAIDGEIRAKQAAVLCYRSQLAFQLGGKAAAEDAMAAAAAEDAAAVGPHAGRHAELLTGATEALDVVDLGEATK